MVIFDETLQSSLNQRAARKSIYAKLAIRKVVIPNLRVKPHGSKLSIRNHPWIFTVNDQLR